MSYCVFGTATASVSAALWSTGLERLQALKVAAARTPTAKILKCRITFAPAFVLRDGSPRLTRDRPPFSSSCTPAHVATHGINGKSCIPDQRGPWRPREGAAADRHGPPVKNPKGSVPVFAGAAPGPALEGATEIAHVAVASLEGDAFHCHTGMRQQTQRAGLANVFHLRLKRHAGGGEPAAQGAAGHVEFACNVFQRDALHQRLVGGAFDCAAEVVLGLFLAREIFQRLQRL